MNDGQPTEYSITNMPVAAFWERVEIFKKVDDEILGDIREAGRNHKSEAANYDLLDAFVLVITASELTGDTTALPQNWPAYDRKEPKDLPMEMVYPERSEQRDS